MDLMTHGSVTDAAMAAEAEIGHHIFSQEAYTTQTMLHEVQKQKSDFNDFINNMIALLKLSLNVLHLKQASYRSRFARTYIIGFVISILVTLITGFRVMYSAFRRATADQTNAGLVQQASTATTTTASPSLTTTTAVAVVEGVTGAAGAAIDYAIDFLTPGEVLAFDLAIFVLSTVITSATAFALFRGWKKKAEDMSQVSFKVQSVKSSLPQSQQQLKFINTPEEMHLLRTSFMTREFKSFADAIQAMDDHLRLGTLVAHLPDQYALNVRKLEDDDQYQQKLLEIYIRQQERLEKLAARAATKLSTSSAVSKPSISP